MNLEILRCEPSHGAGRKRPPVLFVHGAYCGAWIWVDPFMPYFADQGHPCYAVSLRGHGGSEGEFNQLVLADFVDDLETVTGRIGAPPILIGHSMGGLVVQHFLARGNTARAAVLMASVPPSGLASSMFHMTLFSPDLMWQFGLLQTLGPQAVSASVVRRAFFSEQSTPESVKKAMAHLRPEPYRLAAELMTPSLPKPPTGPNRPPMLVIGGDADIFMPVTGLHESATYFRADLDILKGAPHGLMIDDHWWQPTADSILAWLDAKLP